MNNIKYLLTLLLLVSFSSFAQESDEPAPTNSR